MTLWERVIASLPLDARMFVSVDFILFCQLHQMIIVWPYMYIHLFNFSTLDEMTELHFKKRKAADELLKSKNRTPFLFDVCELISSSKISFT